MIFPQRNLFQLDNPSPRHCECARSGINICHKHVESDGDEWKPLIDNLLHANVPPPQPPLHAQFKASTSATLYLVGPKIKFKLLQLVMRLPSAERKSRTNS